MIETIKERIRQESRKKSYSRLLEFSTDVLVRMNFVENEKKNVPNRNEEARAHCYRLLLVILVNSSSFEIVSKKNQNLKF